jgi:cytoskeletal protein RodZ
VWDGRFGDTSRQSVSESLNLILVPCRRPALPVPLISISIIVIIIIHIGVVGWLLSVFQRVEEETSRSHLPLLQPLPTHQTTNSPKAERTNETVKPFNDCEKTQIVTEGERER